MTLLSDLALDAHLLRATEKLGFGEATAVQNLAIPAALAGSDLLVSARTGSGKTAAFLLPLIHRLLQSHKPKASTRGLILLPTRELAIQTEKVFVQLAAFTYIKAGLVIGGEAYKHQVNTIRRNPEVLIATPGRLVEHIKNTNTDFRDLEVLVLDEADRMLDMGFAEAMQTIVDSCNPERQNLFFSATLKHGSLTRVISWLREPLSIEIDSAKEGHENITQLKILADDLKHKQAIAIALCSNPEAEPALDATENITPDHKLEPEQAPSSKKPAEKILIFCNTRLQCQQVSNLLQSKKIKAGYLHGEISQNDRKQILNRFRDNSLRVLVATDVAARGLDIDNVDLVINFTVAHSGDEHIHRIGRTGRGGQTGRAITLVGHEDWNLNSSIERYLKVRFDVIKIPGLEGNYTGPKKLKSSGKAAGTKKREGAKGKAATATKAKTRKSSELTTKPKDGSANDGNAPLRKKPKNS